MLPPDPALFNSRDREPTSDSGRSRRNDAISLGMFVSLLLACLLQVLRQTNRIRQPKVAGNRLESVRYLQAG